MPKHRYLHQHIGDPILVLEPDAYTSAALAASDRTGVPIAGCTSILFLLLVGDPATCSATTMQLMYSCDAYGSNASATTTVWANATDAVWAAFDSDDINTVRMLELDVSRKAMTEPAGCVFVSASATLADAVDMACVAIPVLQNANLPATNAVAAVIAYGDPDT